MKIAILTRNARGYSVRRLRHAAVERGHKVRAYDTLKFALHVESREPDLLYNQRAIENCDVVIPRIGSSITPFGTAVVRQFEQMGVSCLNTSTSISVSRDKLRSLQVLSRHDIGMPESAFVRRKEDVIPAIRGVGGAPVIIKLLEGSQGIGVILADQETIAAAIIETLQSAMQSVLIQKFVSESKGKDIRALVVGGRVVAAMRRRAAGHEFRSNVHRGGRTEPVELDEEYQRTAVKAAQIMGLRLAGVDILESEEGPQVMEVNSSPGLEGIEKATGVDVAGAIIEHLEELVLFPEIDLRQRLTLKSGYGVAEFQVNRESSLCNTPIAETGLRERDVLVLSIQRAGISIPAPHGRHEILPGDTLVCYGKILTLKSLIPAKKPRRRKKKRNSSSGGGRK
ncbi:MAG TPA: RimK family alpha-L-glutamate ligase [Candidatus Krumholzibacteria bacterium]|nr:RimK family alpha-L-glutamate ligase [Candidatus Krumholzibacteria bacterium]